MFLITVVKLFQTTEFVFVEMITLADEEITVETNKHYGGWLYDYQLSWIIKSLANGNQFNQRTDWKRTKLFLFCLSICSGHPRKSVYFVNDDDR